MSEIISSLLEYFFATSESIFELTQRYEIPSSHASIPLYLFSIPLRSTLNDKRSKNTPQILSRQKPPSSHREDSHYKCVSDSGNEGVIVNAKVVSLHEKNKFPNLYFLLFFAQFSPRNPPALITRRLDEKLLKQKWQSI